MIRGELVPQPPVSKPSSLSNVNLISYLKKRVRFCKAGQIAYHIESWKQITSDKTILQIVRGDIIKCQQTLPVQISHQYNSVSRGRVPLIEKELKSLIEKQVIVHSDNQAGQFISPIFSIPKSDAKIRLI